MRAKKDDPYFELLWEITLLDEAAHKEKLRRLRLEAIARQMVILDYMNGITGWATSWSKK